MRDRPRRRQCLGEAELEESEEDEEEREEDTDTTDGEQERPRRAWREEREEEGEEAAMAHNDPGATATMTICKQNTSYTTKLWSL